jgi:hypothetical protein
MIITEEDVLELFTPPAQEHTLALADACLKHYWGKPTFLGYIETATREAGATDWMGIRMVVLTSIQMGYEKGYKDAMRVSSHTNREDLQA